MIPGEFLRAVEIETGLPHGTLAGLSRTAKVIRIRHAAYRAMRLMQRPCNIASMPGATEPRFSFPQLGRIFRRDHSTILHGIAKVEARISEDPVYAALCDRINALAGITQLQRDEECAELARRAVAAAAQVQAELAAAQSQSERERARIEAAERAEARRISMLMVEELTHRPRVQFDEDDEDDAEDGHAERQRSRHEMGWRAGVRRGSERLRKAIVEARAMAA